MFLGVNNVLGPSQSSLFFLFLDFLKKINVNVKNKSTIIFHGLHSYRS